MSATNLLNEGFACHAEQLPALNAEDMAAFEALAISLKEGSAIARQIMQQNAPYEAIRINLFENSIPRSSLDLETIQWLKQEFLNTPILLTQNTNLLFKLLEYEIQPKGTFEWVQKSTINNTIQSLFSEYENQNIITRLFLLDDPYEVEMQYSMFILILEYVQNYIITLTNSCGIIAITTQHNNDSFEISFIINTTLELKVEAYTLGKLLCLASGGKFIFSKTENYMNYCLSYNIR